MSLTTPSPEGYYANSSSKSSPKAAAEDHMAKLHPEGKGKVAVLHKSGIYPGGRRQRSYEIAELPDVIPLYAGLEDVYVSQQRFHFGRKKENLKEIGSLYVDIDFHKIPELQDMDARGVLGDVLAALERVKIPAPTMAIASGRGLYAVWLLSEPIPGAARPRWDACQRHLLKVLLPFGADPGAIDASRVLRLCGTVNSRSGKTVELIAAPGEKWSFDDLANEILPYTREELYDIRVQRAARAARMPPKRLGKPSKGFTPSSMWEVRLEDLHRLRKMRHPRTSGRLPSGERDAFLFIAGVAMSWMVEPRFLKDGLWKLARQVASWDDAESQSRFQAISERVRMLAKGETIEWRGERIDPRYKFKNETIIRELGITDGEMREMQVLISKDEKARRRRERDEKRRREAGVAKRGDVAERNHGEAHRLRSEGLTQKQIADTLKLSERWVRKLLSDYVPNAPELKIPLYGGGVASVAGGGGEELRGVNQESKSKVENPPKRERQSAGENRIDTGCSQSVPLYGGVALPVGSSLESRGVENAAMSDLKSFAPKERHGTGESIPSGEAMKTMGESESHPLGCDCLECYATPPSYAGSRAL